MPRPRRAARPAPRSRYVSSSAAREGGDALREQILLPQTVPHRAATIPLPPPRCASSSAPRTGGDDLRGQILLPQIVPHRAATIPLPPPSYACNSAARTCGYTSREQILLQPDGYIGSVEKRTQKLWVVEGIYMKERVVTYVPGLLKIFDEILVYAADNKQRDSTMDTLRVDIDVAKCSISVFNNGKGIPIEACLRGKGAYVPEVIFGHLSNCAHEVKEEGNGYGVKLANIFSTEFVVEIADGPCQKKYKQVFSENMIKKSEPEITDYRKGVSWTLVTFKPDLAKFNMTYLEEDVIALMRKRVYDMAGILGGTVQVVFNGQKMLLRRGFPDYVYRHVRTIYEDSTKRLPWFCEKVDDQWEVGVSVSEGHFQQVSFVNKIATISGGTHVDYVSDLIVAHAVSFMKGPLQLANIEEHDVKRHLMIFVYVHMDNPTFSSPTKEALTTPQEDFGSELKFSDLFLENATGFLFLKLRGLI